MRRYNGPNGSRYDLGRFRPVERFAYKFPDGEEERLAAVLSMNNNELKSAAMLCLEDRPLSSASIKKKFDEFGADNADNRLALRSNVFGAMCGQSFVKTGCAIGEVFRVSGDYKVRGWRISKTGKKYAIPAAKFSIANAVEYGQSMYEVLGTANTTGGSHAPYNRARILEALADEDGPIREQDICEKTGVMEVMLEHHLPALARAELIDYESINNEGQGQYKWRWADPSRLPCEASETRHKGLVQHARKSMQAVAEILYSRPAYFGEVSDALKGNRPLEKDTVVNIILGLEKQGFVRPVKFKCANNQSEAKITAKGRRIAERHIAPLRRFVGDRGGLEADFDESLIKYGMALYEPHSHAKARPTKERYGTVCELYRAKGPIRPADFAAATGMSMHSAGSTLVNMHSMGLLKRTRCGKAALYSPKKPRQVTLQ